MKNKKIKYTLIGVLIVALIGAIAFGIFLLRNSKGYEPTLEEIVAEKSKAYETDLMDSLSSMETNEDVAEYLVNWGKNKSIKAFKDANNNVIFDFRGTKEHKEDKPTLFVTGFNCKNMELYNEPIVTMMTVAKNSSIHGKFRIIFSPELNGYNIGLKNLDKKYIYKDCDIFYLNQSGVSKLSNRTGEYRDIEVAGRVVYKEPGYDTAYKVSLKNVPVNFAYDKASDVNPIKTLGSILANFESNSILFELANISGGISSGMTPKSSTMTLVINEDDEEKVEGKFQSYIEKFLDKYGEDYPEIEYTYEKVDMPKRVLSRHSAEHIVSLLYTAHSGTYYKDDEGNVVALTNIGKIRESDGKLMIGVSLFSSDPIYMEEMVESYKVIAGLSGAKCKQLTKGSSYIGDSKNMELLESFRTKYMDYTGGRELGTGSTANYFPVDTLELDKGNKNLVYSVISKKAKEYFAGAFITHIMGEDVEE